MSTFKVMSFNIRFANDTDPYIWDERKRVIVNLIQKYQPELIGFQEVTAIQLEFLQGVLKDYHSYGVYRDESPQSEMSPVFVHQQFASIELKDTFWLSETPTIAGSKGWDAHLPRVVSWTILTPKEVPDSKILMMNTHFDHIGVDARKQSISLMKAEADRLSTQYKAKTIMTGDFNSFPDRMEAIMENTAFQSVFDVIAPKEGEHLLTCHQYEEVTVGMPIDYIFVEAPMKIVEASIIRDRDEKVFPSDHYPLIATVEYK